MNVNTPPLLGNSMLVASNAGRYPLTLQPLSSGIGGFVNYLGLGTRLAQWHTLDEENQELELLMWFETQQEGSGLADDPSVIDSVAFALSRSLGAQGGPGVGLDTPLSMPANGLRTRFTAKSATVQCWNRLQTVVSCVVRAAIYPCSGFADGADGCISSSHGFAPIPKGARSFRCSPGILDSSATVDFYALSKIVNAEAGTYGNPVASFANQSVGTWTAIPRGAYWVHPHSNWAGAGDATGLAPAYGVEVYFR